MTKDVTHIHFAFDQELAGLNSDIAELGKLVQSQLAQALEALLNRDLTAIDEIIARDKQLDKMEVELHEKAVQTIALRSPMAVDLRRVIVSLKIATMLERMGDYAKNIAKRTKRAIAGEALVLSDKHIKHMGELVQHMLRQVLDAYMQADDALAMEIWLRDVEVDKIYTAIFESLLHEMEKTSAHVIAGSHILFIAKDLERIGDFATGIAEQVYFLANGFMPEDDRPKADKTTTIK